MSVKDLFNMRHPSEVQANAGIAAAQPSSSGYSSSSNAAAQLDQRRINEIYNNVSAGLDRGSIDPIAEAVQNLASIVARGNKQANLRIARHGCNATIYHATSDVLVTFTVPNQELNATIATELMAWIALLPGAD